MSGFLFFKEDDDGFAKGDVRTIYRKYFLAAFGSALISCVYGVVDMTMVGQYQGPDGTAALAVVAPVWNVIYSLGLLTGIGGSVLLSAKRGSGAAGQAEANEYFTTAVLASVLPALLGPTAIWWAMPVTELLVACYAVTAMRHATRALPPC